MLVRATAGASAEVEESELSFLLPLASMWGGKGNCPVANTLDTLDAGLSSARCREL